MALYLFIFISAVFNCIVGSIIGISVYLRDKSSAINKTFAIFCFFVSLWSLGYFFPIVQNSEQLSLLSFRLLHIGAVFVAVSHFHFICAVLDIVNEKKKYIIFAYIFNLFIAIFFIPSKFFITEVVPKAPFHYWANVGLVYIIWLIIWLGYVIASVYLLYDAYKKTTGIKKHQIKYILIGDLLTFSTGSMNFFLFFDIPILPYLNIFVSGQMFSIFYIIVRYRFIDIKLNSLHILNTFFSLLLSIVSAYLVYLLYYFIFPSAKIVDFIGILFVALLSVFFIIFYHFTNLPFVYRIFRLSDFEKFKNIILEFRNKNIFYNSITEFQTDIESVFCKKLEISSAKILILDKENEYKYHELIKYFKNENKCLVTEEVELEQNIKNINYPFYSELKSLGKICFPLFFKKGKNIIGFFILGDKPFYNPYTKEELDILEYTAHHISLFLAIILYNSELHKEVKLKTQELKKQNQEMHELLRQQADFIAVTAHEFRTPLSIALFHVDELIDSYQNSLEEKHQLSTVSSSLINLKSLMQKLFELQQYDLNKVTLNYKKVDIVKFINDICNEFGNIFAEKSIKVSFTKKPDYKIFIPIDELQIRQVIHNIFTNAFKFTKSEVRIELIDEKDSILLTISDDGEGIPMKERKRIFEKFQTRKVSMAMGIGLGLYISKKIIELHKGKIWVDDSKLGGAQISIRLKKVN